MNDEKILFKEKNGHHNHNKPMRATQQHQLTSRLSFSVAMGPYWEMECYLTDSHNLLWRFDLLPTLMYTLCFC